ncbi:MAG: hypothetical protein AB1521_04185 [Bacteroidota bacterium]
MEKLLLSIGGLIFGALCSIYAKKKNRYAKNWFLAGFVAGPIGLIIISILPSLDDQETTVGNLSEENVSLKIV